MTLIKLPEMSEDEIKEVIESENICRIAFIDGEYPYISPFQYLYHDGNFYFHFTDYGKKKEILKKNKNVCISIEKFGKNLKEFCFISIQGKLELVDGKQERRKIFNYMIENAKARYSENFLSAHGFKSEDGLGSSISENQLIYKLVDICGQIGLKN